MCKLFLYFLCTKCFKEESPTFVCQVLDLFPSSQGLELLWSSVVKLGQSLYREAPGKDPFRPDQKTPVKNFFLAGSYTKQVNPRLTTSKLHLSAKQILLTYFRFKHTTK